MDIPLHSTVEFSSGGVSGFDNYLRNQVTFDSTALDEAEFTHRIQLDGRFSTYIVNPAQIAKMYGGFINVSDKHGEVKKNSSNGVLISKLLAIHGEVIIRGGYFKGKKIKEIRVTKEEGEY